MQMEIWSAFEVRNPLAIIDAAAPDDSVYVVAFGEQELGKVRAILTGNAGDEGGVIIVLHYIFVNNSVRIFFQIFLLVGND